MGYPPLVEKTEVLVLSFILFILSYRKTRILSGVVSMSLLDMLH
jgi:hypothetical protein